MNYEKLRQKIAGEEVLKVVDYLESKKQAYEIKCFTVYYNKETKVTARPSGTEPKIKYYFSVQEPLSSKTEYLSTKQRLTKKIAKSSRNGFIKTKINENKKKTFKNRKALNFTKTQQN